MTTSDIALLVLKNDTVLKGHAWGTKGRTLGEIVFSTGMTGYQEMLTNPSHHHQVAVVTASHIDSTDVNDEGPESLRIWVAGFVVRDTARRASNWRLCCELEDELISQDIISIANANARAIIRHIRGRRAMRAGIFSGDTLPMGVQYLGDKVMASLVRIVVESFAMNGTALTAEVPTDEAHVVEPLGDFGGKEPIARVVVVDLSIKSRAPYHLAVHGVRAYVILSTASFANIGALKSDDVSLSSGPDDPSTADREIGVLRAVLDAGIPYFGVCFGYQFLGRALGHGTYKLDYGHRDIDQPMKEVAMGHTEITAHNHGFAVDVPVGESSVVPLESGRYGRVKVSYVGLNDGVIEDLHTLGIPVFSVRYHPEIAAGPHDGELLFDRFISLMTAAKKIH